MTDPISIGTVVAAAFSMVADAAVKGAVGEAVKDGYRVLKERLSHSASSEVAALEARPSSSGLQLAVAEIVDAQEEDERRELEALAKNLVIALKAQATAVGLEVGKLEALEAQIGRIDVSGGIGVSILEAKVELFKIGDISVTDHPGK